MAIDAAVAQPRLGRGDHARGLARPLRCAPAHPATGRGSRAASASPVPGQRGLGRAQIVRAGQIDERRQLAPASTAPGATSCGTSKVWTRWLGGAGVDAGHRRVGGAEIDADDVPRGRSRRAGPGVRHAGSAPLAHRILQLPARRLAAGAAVSRGTHHSSSVPTSVTRDCSDTGTTVPGSAPWPRGQRGLDRAQLVQAAHPRDRPARRRRRSCAARRRRSGTRPSRRPPGRAPRRAALAPVPSSMPNGATHSALTGGAKPGIAGIAASMPM